ncbi:conserved hypothetical protein [Chloroherpeton thalassium ATCC 35110]|uniref:Putative cysteine ligase BshC n=1 Tax=Chloroherpeton thalassium (strain ATCC 35110 / GB-78) TaxID=517418 RepID=BSHC_CHLT3|nr:bacillithiol biosynthesis cysteine-adding enzyme BshC [Chloroherpeton thalassium]B3QYH5.1 RecName: Full=Putative cysteine ligase BshC [Chloroherpeton thalassium ATCC 35110]ACF13603.1 conserved hypothetical protein [Chloroherpeton thalassium ATCC 35110]
MQSYSIPFHSISEGGKQFSQLFLDYTSNTLATDALISQFYQHDYRNPAHLSAQIQTVSGRTYQRPELVLELTRQNQLFGSGPKTFERIQSLLSKKTLAVVTGQQVGFLTGPVYTIYKTLSAIVLTEKWHEHYPDFEFVPVFWLESEDHDYEEISHVSLLKGNSLERFSYSEASYQALSSAGATQITPEFLDWLGKEILEAFPESDYKQKMLTLVRESYKEGVSYEMAFATLLARLFYDEGLIIVSSHPKGFKTLAKSVFIRELETFPASSQNIIAQSARLEESGYDAQAKPRPINLYFFQENQRLKIEPRRQGSVELLPGKTTFSQHEMLEFAHSAPELFSPNVVLRPIVQDTVLPTVAYVAGPGEISYFGQFLRNYQFFNIPMPIIYPRASLSLLEPKISRVFEKSARILNEKEISGSLSRFYQNSQQFINELLLAASTVDIEDEATTAIQGLSDIFKKFGLKLSEIDPTLAQSVEKVMQSTLNQVENLKSKTIKAEKQRHNDLIAQIEKSRDNLLPGGVLQERVLNGFHFFNKFDTTLIKLLKELLLTKAFDKHLIVPL